MAQSKNNIQTGRASYYAKKFHNRRAASGRVYKKNEYVCAHRTYPFGTKLLVKNSKNGKEVVVEVIDRGPHKKMRIIDLSWIAAKELGIIQHGIATVEVSEYMEPDKKTNHTYKISDDDISISNID